MSRSKTLWSTVPWVLLVCVSFHCPNKVIALVFLNTWLASKVSYEVARVLKPGGVYLLTDYRDPERVQELFQREEWESGSLT